MCNALLKRVTFGSWMVRSGSKQRVAGYCTLCRSRCGAVSVVEDGRLTGVEVLNNHPTGGALCAKGRAAPEIVASPRRLTVPLKRAPAARCRRSGWVEVTWEEALTEIAARLGAIRSEERRRGGRLCGDDAERHTDGRQLRMGRALHPRLRQSEPDLCGRDLRLAQGLCPRADLRPRHRPSRLRQCRCDRAVGPQSGAHLACARRPVSPTRGGAARRSLSSIPSRTARASRPICGCASAPAPMVRSRSVLSGI